LTITNESSFGRCGYPTSTRRSWWPSGKRRSAWSAQELNRLSDLRGKKQAQFDVAQQTKRQLGRYASQQKITQADLWLLKCEGELEVANQQHAAVMQKINFMTLTEMKPLQERLNALAAEEAKLAHAVLGTGYTTPEGIVVPGRGRSLL